MPSIFYAHRLQRVLQEMVVNSDLTLHLTDENSSTSLMEHADSIKAVAAQAGVNARIEQRENGAIVTFKKAR